MQAPAAPGNGRVDVAKIDGVPQVAVLQIAERWIGTVQSAADLAAHDELRRRGAVVGAAARVLPGTPAELRVGHHRNVVPQAGSDQVLPEGREAVAQEAEQAL